MIFEDNEIISVTELKERLHICDKTWERYRKKILEHLALYCDFAVEGNPPRIYYHIIHQFSEYERFHIGRKPKEEMNKIYTNEIIKSIKRHPLATYTSINHEIIQEEPIKELNHAEGTSYGYVRTCTAKAFGKGKYGQGTIGRVTDKIWAKKINNLWYELPEEELQTLKEYLTDAFDGAAELTVDVITDQQNDVINPTEAEKTITELNYSCYVSAIRRFRDKFHYFPRKVYKYEIAGWSEEPRTEEIIKEP